MRLRIKWINLNKNDHTKRNTGTKFWWSTASIFFRKSQSLLMLSWVWIRWTSSLLKWEISPIHVHCFIHWKYFAYFIRVKMNNLNENMDISCSEGFPVWNDNFKSLLRNITCIHQQNWRVKLTSFYFSYSSTRVLAPKVIHIYMVIMQLTNIRHSRSL